LPPSKRFFVAVVESESHLNWLESSLGGDSSLVACDDPNVDRVLQLVDTATANAVFIRFGMLDHAQRCQFVLRMLERKPNLTVIALGESDDRDLMLSVLRSGARDFVPIGAPSADLDAALDRVSARASNLELAGAPGSIHAVISARPDGTTSAFTVHLALAMRKLLPPERKVLLLDLGMPIGDSLLLLDLRPTYSFFDAIRSVRRFDQSLVHAVFAQHGSGMSVLTLPEDPSELEQIQAADAIALTGVLGSYFDHIVVNLAGLYDLELLYPMLQKASDVMIHTDQCVATCRGNYRLIEEIRHAKVPITNGRVVIDRYSSRLDPSAEQIAELFELESWSCIPPDGLRLLEAINTGRSLFEIAPDSAYGKATAQLASQILRCAAPQEERGPLLELWSRFKQLIQKEVE